MLYDNALSCECQHTAAANQFNPSSFRSTIPVCQQCADAFVGSCPSTARELQTDAATRQAKDALDLALPARHGRVSPQRKLPLRREFLSFWFASHTCV
jgi:hypothetical protein